MIRNGQVHNIGAHDMQAQTAFVASVFHVAASIADFRHLARLTLSFATDPLSGDDHGGNERRRCLVLPLNFR